MSSKMSKVLSILLIVTMAFVLITGCSRTPKTQGEPSEQTDEQPEDTDDTPDVAAGTKKNWWEMLDEVEDTSDLPDWEGEQLELTVWVGQGAGNRTRYDDEGDVVYPEAARVTGVRFSVDNSFDNAGQPFESKLAMIAASNDWPDIINTFYTTDISQLAEEGIIYDLTELLPEYCPHIMEKFPVDKCGDIWKGLPIGGEPSDTMENVYFIPSLLQDMWVPDIIPNVDMDRYLLTSYVYDPYGPYPFRVRDDMLKAIFPEAKTVEEIKELYMEKGEFTREDIMDVPIKSKDDFIKFLRDLDALGYKEGNRPVKALFTHAGGDSFALCNMLQFIVDGIHQHNSYYIYWDKETQRVEYMFKQPFFKESLKVWNDLIREGIIPQEALIDSPDAWEEKMNNGLYATSYAWLNADEAKLAENNKPFRYRPVFMDIPLKSHKFVSFKGVPKAWERYYITKELNEEQLIQVPRFFDYIYSDIGQKLVHWGPRSAGLWTEENGKRVFIDKELEANVVYGNPNNKSLYYNICNWTTGETCIFPSYPLCIQGGGVLSPVYMYERERRPEDAMKLFHRGFVDYPEWTIGIAPDIALFKSAIQEVEKFLNAQEAFEDALKRVFAARTDEEFEKAYDEMVATAERNGLTDETLEKINDYYVNVINKDYMDNLK